MVGFKSTTNTYLSCTGPFAYQMFFIGIGGNSPSRGVCGGETVGTPWGAGKRGTCVGRFVDRGAAHSSTCRHA